VRALVLCDTGARIGSEESWNERIMAVRTNGLGSIANAVLNRWFTSAFDGAARRGWANMLMRTPVNGYAGTCAALRDCDLRATVGAINKPAMVLCGDADTSTTPELNRELAGLIPGAQSEIIANAAHLPCIEQPAAMGAAIQRFIAGLAANDTFQRGMTVRRAVLGDAHVDRAEANKTAFDTDFQRLITEFAWGSVWARPGLDRKTRHLITLALIAALGHEHEFAMHVRAMRNTGATADELKEALLHVAVYAGVPAANAAIAIAKKELQ
jgi:3-oxoadipate enol-lactonase/4-carboxymuconolactone decarboxylase